MVAASPVALARPSIAAPRAGDWNAVSGVPRAFQHSFDAAGTPIVACVVNQPAARSRREVERLMA